MAYTFNQKNWVAGEVITANGVNRIEECLGHLVDEKQNILYFDAAPTAGSPNLVDSNGIYNALKALDISTIDRRPTSNSKNAVQSRGIYEALLGKQDLLVFDSTPKSNSSNPVTSQGIYQALNLKQNNLTFDSTPISDSNNPVTSKGIYQALSLKQDNLTFDNVPDSGSNNPVTSNGIYRALSLKQNNLTFDSTPILNSSNPVTSEGIYISLQNLLGEVNNSLDTLNYNFYQELNTKQNKLTFDNTPINNSNNPVTSNGIYNALQEKADKSTTVSNVTYDTTNKKITKTINGTTSNVVSAATLKTDMSLNNVENKSSATIRSEITSSNITTALGFTPLDESLKGVNNGIAELDSNGKVPSSQLPSYVDDVLEYTTKTKFPSTGETSKIYVDITTNKTYRWSGSDYIEISASLALGTTSSTAYRGDYGNAAYAHAVTNKGSAFSSGLYKITTNSEGHVIAATAVAKSDITSLGIPGNNTTYTFDGTYNASTNKAATVSTVTNAIAALDGNLNDTTPGAGKTLTAFSETDGKVNAIFSNISITKSQVSDLGTIGAAAAKGVDTSIEASSTSTNVPTSKAVAAFVEGKGYKTTDNNTTYSLTQDSSDGHKITLRSSSGTAQTITIPDNNTWRAVSDSVSSTASTIAASSKAVKTAYDLAASKTANTGTVTSIVAGTGLSGGTITGSGIIKAKLKSETALTNNSIAATETSGRIYPVVIDKSGYLAVNVPWTDTNTQTITGVKGDAESYYRTGNVNITATNIGLDNVENKSSATIRDEITSSNITTALGFTPLNASLKGAKGGIAELDSNGIVPSSQLPAYVDTILEYNSLSNFPSVGESGKIYVALDTNKSYRWSGTQYTEISSSISLGETQGTAYEGYKGKANALAINNLQNNKANKSTTISGYGIIDAKIENGTITLGNNTIQPIVDNNYNHTDNNFTNEEKNKLAQINIGAEKNIQSDWNITDINSDAYIKNKPNITGTITENNNSLVTSSAVYTELIKKQNNLINVPEISEIKPTDYIYIERNQTIYKILASKLGTFTPDESEPNAIETNDGNIITDENGNEIIIDTNTTDTVETNDGKIILTEDQRELNLG